MDMLYEGGIMRDIKFGDYVSFDQEYVSNHSNKTIDIGEANKGMVDVKTCEDIRTKTIRRHKTTKHGLFMGVQKINLSVMYDFIDEQDMGEFGVRPWCYIVEKTNFIDVAEVRVEGIKKSYFVPLNNVRRNHERI